ncbi:hypothetical protein [Sphingobacterium daejeonense]|uniref:hypothetical protein n=1 Tax=Sphingobacterium daejeonense TaxID=371142 RepID=UPI0010C2510D|nr:hypothetical protein [Sphingobacterium daejeonense]VTP97857.1 Uncharacterised protein [Sphingobacterium daejeonense]
MPLLLVYPVEEIFGDIASLVSKRNITRIYQNAINISSNIEKPLVEDMTYRYDHIKYDVPTSKTIYGSKTEERHFKYSE